jgi:hypothetical protein
MRRGERLMRRGVEQVAVVMVKRVATKKASLAVVMATG